MVTWNFWPFDANVSTHIARWNYAIFFYRAENIEVMYWDFSDFNNKIPNVNISLTNWTRISFDTTNTTDLNLLHCYVQLCTYHVIFWPFTNFTHSSINCHLTDATHKSHIFFFFKFYFRQIFNCRMTMLVFPDRYQFLMKSKHLCRLYNATSGFIGRFVGKM